MHLSIAIGIAEENNKILFIKREKGDFQGLWVLPGGKIEDNEHIHNAVEREFKEEFYLNNKVNYLALDCYYKEGKYYWK